MTEWNKDLEKRILNKSRFTLTFRIIRVLVLLWVIYFFYMQVLHFITDKSQAGNEGAFYSTVALEWTVPNVKGGLDFRESEMNIFGTKNISYDLIKRVGQEEMLIGEVTFTKRLFTRPTDLTYTHPGYQRLSAFSFSLPKDPRTGQKLDAHTSPHVWETLDMLPEGTVGELAFSTNDFIESTELLEALQDYDLHILWMPLYTGEFETYEPESWGSSTNMIMLNNVIGLTGGTDFNRDFSSTTGYMWLDEQSILKSQQIMLNHMEEILNKPKSYYEYFLRLGQLEEKYDYLKEEGFIVYGSVVTGPVKELLKLKELPFIQGEQLGEVELWNWNMDEQT